MLHKIVHSFLYPTAEEGSRFSIVFITFVYLFLFILCHRVVFNQKHFLTDTYQTCVCEPIAGGIDVLS